LQPPSGGFTNTMTRYTVNTSLQGDKNKKQDCIIAWKKLEKKHAPVVPTNREPAQSEEQLIQNAIDAANRARENMLDLHGCAVCGTLQYEHRVPIT
jgi:hypothetical protein